jgi:N-alpha-acetyltransferase 15/16, NatA auxiliary subunit
MIRCDRIDDAEYTIGLFSKQEPETVKVNVLNEMQCMWFQNELGNSYLRKKNYALALQQFLNVNKHFDDIYEDQYDFHTYAIRKMSLRAYADMIRFGDELHAKKFYFQAAIGAVKTYLQLFDHPDSFNATEFEVPKVDKKSEAFLEKSANDKKRELLLNDRKRKEFEDSLLLIETKEPLEKATPFMNELLKFNSDKMETHLLAIELFTKQSLIYNFNFLLQRNIHVCLNLFKWLKRFHQIYQNFTVICVSC